MSSGYWGGLPPSFFGYIEVETGHYTRVFSGPSYGLVGVLTYLDGWDPTVTYYIESATMPLDDGTDKITHWQTTLFSGIWDSYVELWVKGVDAYCWMRGFTAPLPRPHRKPIDITKVTDPRPF
jgi:hypothetical protein